MLEHPAFKEKDESDAEYKSEHYHRIFNLMQGKYTKNDVIEYNHKLICSMAAGGDFDLQNKFYEDTAMSGVWEHLMLGRWRALINT
jgi:hypothetical protein